MSSKINGTTGIVIAVVALAAILIFGYMKFLKGPDTVSPEETRRMMMQHDQASSHGGDPGKH